MFGVHAFGASYFGQGPSEAVFITLPVTAEISFGAHVLVEVASMAVGVLVTPVVGTLMLIEAGSRAVNVKVD